MKFTKTGVTYGARGTAFAGLHCGDGGKWGRRVFRKGEWEATWVQEKSVSNSGSLDFREGKSTAWSFRDQGWSYAVLLRVRASFLFILTKGSSEDLPVPFTLLIKDRGDTAKDQSLIIPVAQNPPREPQLPPSCLVPPPALSPLPWQVLGQLVP